MQHATSSRYPGILITVEGIDGAGKTELIKRLASLLHDEKHTVIVTKEPGGTHLGAALKKTLLQEETECDPRVELLLFAADRAEHFSKVVIPALTRGAIVISDRMADSAFAYQGYGRNLDTAVIDTVNRFAMHDIQPNITLYLEISIAQAKQRYVRRHESDYNAQQLETMERQKEPFWQAVLRGYEALKKAHPHRIHTLDATQTSDTLAAHAHTIVTQYLAQRSLTCQPPL